MSDTKVLTPEQIAELRAAIAAATQGPMSMWGGRGWPKGWDAVPDAEIVWPIAQATASTDGGYVAAALSHEDQRLLWLLWNAAPALLDAAERCARLSESIGLKFNGESVAVPAIDIIENVAVQLASAIARAEAAEKAERARVVAYLRDWAKLFNGAGDYTEALTDAADEIERGDHAKAGK